MTWRSASCRRNGPAAPSGLKSKSKSSTGEAYLAEISILFFRCEFQIQNSCDSYDRREKKSGRVLQHEVPLGPGQGQIRNLHNQQHVSVCFRMLYGILLRIKYYILTYVYSSLRLTFMCLQRNKYDSAKKHKIGD